MRRKTRGTAPAGPPAKSPTDSDCLECLDVLLAFPRGQFPERGERNPDCRGCYETLLESLRTHPSTGAAQTEILLVGNSPTTCTGLRTALGKLGARITEHPDASAALESFLTIQPEIALIAQPPAQARGLMKRLFELDPDAICIVASEGASPEELNLCQASGAFAAIDPGAGAGALSDILYHAFMVIAVQRDRGRLREQLVLERNSSRSTLLHLPLGLITLDAKLETISCNPAFERTTGIEREKVIGLENLLRRAMPEKKARNKLLKDVERSGEEGRQVRTSALPLVHAKDGSLRLIDWHITPLPAETQTGASFLLVLQDVTNERHLAHQVLQSERLAAIGEMAASVAHELKNPLAGLAGALDILLEELPPQSDLMRIRDAVKIQLRRLNELAGDLLNFAKPVRIALTNIRFRDLVQSVTSSLSHHPALEKVELVELGSDVQMSVDAVQFPIVLQNLVLNAAQAAGGEGTVRVRAENTTGKVLITVEDDGPGFADDAIAKVFTPFFTTKSKGTGLGLPICRKIVEAHGGQISAANRKDGGAILALTVPVLAVD